MTAKLGLSFLEIISYRCCKTIQSYREVGLYLFEELYSLTREWEHSQSPTPFAIGKLLSPREISLCVLQKGVYTYI